MKWYRDNVDSTFDIEYDPSSAPQQPQQPQDNAGFNPYVQQYNNAGVADAYPKYKKYLGLAHIIFLLTLPFSSMDAKIGIAVLIFGII